MIKFICKSDTHGLIPGIHDESDIAGWLHAGDFYNRLTPHAVPATFDHLSKWYKNLTKPLYIVRGNHDCFDLQSIFKAANHIEGSLVEAAPKVWVAGMGWSGYNFFDLPREMDLEKQRDDIIRQASFKLKSGDRSILLSHYPAWIKSIYDNGSDPDGWLFENVRDVIDAIKPAAFITGHIHELFGQSAMYNGTLIVHVGPSGGTLSVDEATGQALFEFF
jgi:Icc-related predicted phosphoesterase